MSLKFSEFYESYMSNDFLCKIIESNLIKLYNKKENCGLNLFEILVFEFCESKYWLKVKKIFSSASSNDDMMYRGCVVFNSDKYMNIHFYGLMDFDEISDFYENKNGIYNILCDVGGLSLINDNGTKIFQINIDENININDNKIFLGYELVLYLKVNKIPILIKVGKQDIFYYVVNFSALNNNYILNKDDFEKIYDINIYESELVQNACDKILFEQLIGNEKSIVESNRPFTSEGFYL